MFTKFILSHCARFEQFIDQNTFEQFPNNRQVAILVSPVNDTIPIIRTTTIHEKPLQPFSIVHHNLINCIKETTNMENLEFNNAMAEVYDSNYTNMKYHSDQALDLEENSYICLFSCYEDEHEKNPRKLKIKNKRTKITTELSLDNNSIILFSKETNDLHLHKIVLDPPNAKSSRWLGITLRLSKTFIRVENGIPYFVETGKRLRLATEEEKKEFYRHKRLENERIGYVYPEIDYTLSWNL